MTKQLLPAMLVCASLAYGQSGGKLRHATGQMLLQSLAPEQQDQIVKLRDEFQVQAIDLRADLQKLRLTLRRQMRADKPNMRTINGTVDQLVIHTLKDGAFHADLLIKTPKETFALDCRPSDGMVLATLMGAPMYLSLEVLEEAGQELDERFEPTARNEETPSAAVTERSREEATEGGRSVLETLQAQLERLVAEEAYEEAAQLRDQIRAWVKQIEARKP